MGTLLGGLGSIGVNLLTGGVSAFVTIFAGICAFFLQIISWLVTFEINIMLHIAAYNDFGKAGAITFGWGIARDISNMFFIVVLLVIAIATILRIERYDWKQHLPRVLIMAVLINFSRTIALLFIDISQVIMLTFVSTYHDALGNFIDAFGITDTLNITGGAFTGDLHALQVTDLLASYLLALLLIVVVGFVMAAMIAVLIGRVIMLWFLVVLSPLAFFASTFPRGEKYHEEWWTMFVNNLVSGPALAFFIWLSMQTMATITGASEASLFGAADQVGAAQIGITKLGTMDNLIKFVLSTGLFIIGLDMSQKLATIGGEVAGTVAHGITAATVKPIEGMKWLVGATAAQLLSYTPFPTWEKIKHGYERSEEERKHTREYRTHNIAGALARIPGLAWVGKISSPADAFNTYMNWHTLGKLMTGDFSEFTGLEARDKLADSEKKGRDAAAAFRASDDAGAEYERAMTPEEKKKREEDINNRMRDIDAQIRTGEFTFAKEINRKTYEDEDKMYKTEMETLEKQGKVDTQEYKEFEQKRQKLKADYDLGQTNKQAIASALKALSEKLGGTASEEYKKAEKELKDNHKKGVVKVNDSLPLTEQVKRDAEQERDALYAELNGLNPKEGEKAKAKAEKERLESEMKTGKMTLDVKQQSTLREERNQLEKMAKYLKEIAENEKKEAPSKAEALQAEATAAEKAGDTATAKRKREEAAYALEAPRLKQAQADASEEKVKDIDQALADNTLDLSLGVSVHAEEFEKDLEKQLKAIQRTYRYMDINIVGSQDEKDELKKKADALLVTAERAKKEAEEAAAEAEHARLPVDYERRKEMRLAINKEKSEMTTDSWKELVSIFKDAEHEQNPIKAAAALLKLTETANENEIFNAYGTRSDARGLREFTEEILIKKLGMGRDEAMSVANDVSFAGEKVKHWQVARAVTVKAGQQMWTDDDDHQIELAAEMRKLDRDQMLRGANRLAFGYEIVRGRTREERARNFNAGEGRTYHHNPSGLSFFTEALPTQARNIATGRFGPNIAVSMSMPTPREDMEHFWEDSIKKNPQLRGLLLQLLSQIQGYAGVADEQQDPYLSPRAAIAYRRRNQG